MAARAHAEWHGDLGSGNGSMTTATGLSGDFSASSRFEDGEGTNPEELVGAALAGCFSMALSNELHKAGIESRSVTTDATVSLSMDGGPSISRIGLSTTIDADGERDEIEQVAQAAKENCPVSQALASVPEITLDITHA